MSNRKADTTRKVPDKMKAEGKPEENMKSAVTIPVASEPSKCDENPIEQIPGWPEAPNLGPKQSDNLDNPSTALMYAKKIEKGAILATSNIATLPALPRRTISEEGRLQPAIQFLTEKGYSIMEKLGTGNYSNVYLVKTRSMKEMAVKIIQLDQVSKNYKFRFLPRELEIIARLRHHNIVRIYGIQTSRNLCFIFMEYVSNGTLGDFIRKNGAIPEWITKRMVQRIAKALQYMHFLGIAHRDMKLENVLLDKGHNPKLTDFSYSLVCIKDPATGNSAISKTFCGSLPYMPPEILTKKPYDPMAADMWSLGVCVFIMLNDRIPFRFTDVAAMIKHQLAREWSFRKKMVAILSSECKDAVSRMLEPEPSKRIKSSQLLEHKWFDNICDKKTSNVNLKTQKVS